MLNRTPYQPSRSTSPARTTSADSTPSESALLVDALGAARLLCCSRRHVEDMNREGLLPVPVRLGRLLRWSRSELAAWIEAGAPPRIEWERKKAAGSSPQAVKREPPEAA
jgi:excisionase family DNA binding protein